jgi:hypothetical protein
MSTPEERRFGRETDAEVSSLPVLDLENEVADERLHIRHGGRGWGWETEGFELGVRSTARRSRGLGFSHILHRRKI